MIIPHGPFQGKRPDLKAYASAADPSSLMAMLFAMKEEESAGSRPIGFGHGSNLALHVRGCQFSGWGAPHPMISSAARTISSEASCNNHQACTSFQQEIVVAAARVCG